MLPDDFDWDEETAIVFLSARHRMGILNMIKDDFKNKPDMKEDRKKSLQRLHQIIMESLVEDGVFPPPKKKEDE